MREDSLIYILSNLVLILKQTEQNQPNLPKIKRLQKISVTIRQKILSEKH